MGFYNTGLYLGPRKSGLWLPAAAAAPPPEEWENLSDVIAVYDFADEATITTTGSRITDIQNKADPGTHDAAEVTSDGPDLVDPGGGLNKYADFDGSQQLLTEAITGVTDDGKTTIWAEIWNGGGVSGRTYLCDGSVSVNRRTCWIDDHFFDLYAGTSRTDVGFSYPDDWEIIAIQFDTGAAGGFWKEGVQVAGPWTTGTHTFGNTHKLRIGMKFDQTLGFLGRLGFLCIQEGHPTAQQHLDMAAWMRARRPALYGSEQINNPFFDTDPFAGGEWTQTAMVYSAGQISDSAGEINWLGTHATVTFDTAKTWRVLVRKTGISGTPDITFAGAVEGTMSGTGLHKQLITPGSLGVFRLDGTSSEQLTCDWVSVREQL